MGFHRLLSDQDVVTDGGPHGDNAEVAAFLELVTAIRTQMNRWEGSRKQEREKEEGETKKLRCWAAARQTVAPWISIQSWLRSASAPSLLWWGHTESNWQLMIEEMRLYSSIVKTHRRGRPSFLGKGFKGQRIMVMARTRLLGGR